MTSVSHPHNLIDLSSTNPTVNINHHPLQHRYNSTHTANIEPPAGSAYNHFKSTRISSPFSGKLETSHSKNTAVPVRHSENKNAKSWKKARYKKISRFNSEASLPKNVPEDVDSQIAYPNPSIVHPVIDKNQSIVNDTDEFNKIDEDSTDEDSENDNESTCNECHGGGELVCCDGCVKAYHTDCLTPSRRPRLDSESDWFCPDCYYHQSNKRSAKSFPNGLNCLSTNNNNSPHLQEASLILPPSSQRNPTTPHYQNNIDTETNDISQTDPILPYPKEDASPIDKRHKTKHNSGFVSLTSNYLGLKKGASACSDRTQSTSITSGPNSSKDEINQVNFPPEVRHIPKKKRKPIDEGPHDYNRINLGSKHQVPSFPVFFLNRDFYNNEPSSSISTSFSRPSQQAELVYSPFCLDKIKTKRISEGEGAKVVKNDQELEMYVQSCAKIWKNNTGWPPFSPEFALKILHFYGYDPDMALESLCDSHFQFSRICDPPTRKYENKWRPKDKRSSRLLNPFPPTLNTKGYYSRRQNNSYMFR